jgi:hypothetical protein
MAAHHAALVVSVAALCAAGLRVASRWAPGGPERVLAATVVAAAAAVVEALALGLVGAGGSTVALLAAAAATWVLAVRLLERPEVRVSDELAAWWRSLGSVARAGSGAALAAFGWWLAWTLRNPALGFDASLYHLTEVGIWAHGGSPGAVQQVSYEFPVGNYPLVNEVLGAWGAGLSHSFVAPALWPAAAFALTGLAGWTGLRRLGVAQAVALLTVGALLSVPSLVTQVAEPQTDLPALAWLVTAAALAACARERPGLLAPVLIAFGLAAGTKTTVLLLGAVALVLGWRSARPRARELALAAAVALLIGGLWYARNLVTHGSPLWPFAPGPFGDPTPKWLATIDTSFIERPLATLRAVRLREYGQRLAASPLLVLGAVAALLAVRRREVTWAAAAAAVALLAWMASPATGLSASPLVWIPEGWPESGTRYLLPVLAAAALTLALVTKRPGRMAQAATAVLAAVLAGDLVVLAARGAPFLPPLELALAAVAGGTLVALAQRGRAGLSVPGPALAALALVAATAGLSLAADGYVGRHARVAESSALGSDVVAWMAARPDFRDGDEPVAIASRAMIAPLAGDRLQHRLELVPQRESCPRVLARARRGWLVASPPQFADGFLGLGKVSAPLCLRGERPLFRGHNFAVYRLGAGR